MEYKEDVKTRNNTGDDINNIAWEYVDYYDIASISLTIKVGNNFECKMRAAIISKIIKAIGYFILLRLLWILFSDSLERSDPRHFSTGSKYNYGNINYPYLILRINTIVARTKEIELARITGRSLINMP